MSKTELKRIGRMALGVLATELKRIGHWKTDKHDPAPSTLLYSETGAIIMTAGLGRAPYTRKQHYYVCSCGVMVVVRSTISLSLEKARTPSCKTGHA